MKKLLPILAIAISAVAIPVHGQTRRIPDDARRAEVAPIDVAHLAVWSQSMRLAPGTRILDRDNRYITPSAVPDGAIARLRYNNDSSVRDIWLLTDAEISRTDPQPAWPKP